jgi:3-phosphoshikimate 1-carboxyvinyltransferase
MKPQQQPATLSVNQSHQQTPLDWNLKNCIPGSKYLANRAMIIAALTSQPSTLANLPDNNDIRALYDALRVLGYQISWDENGCIHSQGASKRQKPKTGVTIDCGASGTMARFISAVSAMDDFPITITGTARLCERPMGQLFTVLKELGAEINQHQLTDCLPVTIKGPLTANASTLVELPGSISSQYASAMILVGGLFPQGLRIQLLEPVVSSQYIKMTCDLVSAAGIQLTYQQNLIEIQSGSYQLKQLNLNADPCSASYPLAAAAITANPISISPFQYLPQQQGEFAIVDLLRKMGCEIDCSEQKIELKRSQPLQAIVENMSDKPDIVQTLAVVACFAQGTTRFEGISHLRYKESDRIKDTAEELRKFGVEVNYAEDWLEVTGGSEFSPATIDTHDDHRMAMALAQLAWKIEGVKINQPEVVAKSFPGFWKLMKQMGLESGS